ncbi:gamma-glutamylcyclotransferase family protein [Streptomyces sp. NPDC020731]|uniref:gamma-glutamylcyclotransferase family protein n=1 Tax=Streptomyces sp. NPDC020731 TaxID=3365085 RepID=UPI0037873271
MILPFFVHGALRPGERDHDLFPRGRTLREEPGRLRGAVLYEGPGHPYAVEESGGAVSGEPVTAPPEAYTGLLAELDRLEEYVPGDPRHLHERVARDVVRAGDGTAVRTWVYVAAPAVAARLRARGKPVEGGERRGRVLDAAPCGRCPRTRRSPVHPRAPHLRVLHRDRIGAAAVTC